MTTERATRKGSGKTEPDTGRREVKARSACQDVRHCGRRIAERAQTATDPMVKAMIGREKDTDRPMRTGDVEGRGIPHLVRAIGTWAKGMHGHDSVLRHRGHLM